MPVLRELVSRFSFDVDKRSVSDYHKKIGSMKGAALKLGSVLGLSVGAKALFGLGVTAKQAESDLKRLAGSDLGNLNAQLDIMKQRLDNIQEGASNILRQKTINVLASGFIEKFGSANEQIKTFTKLLETATLQSVITGASVEDSFKGLTSFIQTGDAAGLLGVGGITLRQQKRLEARAAIIDPAEIGTEAGRVLRTEMLTALINQVSQEQRKQAANIDRTLVDLKIAQNVALDKTEQLSEAGTNATIKAAAALITGSQSIIDEADNLQKKTGAKESPLFDIIKNKALNLFHESTSASIERRKNIDQKNALEKAVPAGGGMINRGTISQSIKIDIHEASDAKAVANEVEKTLSNAIADAERQLIPSEDKSQ